MTAPRRTDLAALSPLAQLRAGALPRRLVQLVAGLVLYGVSMACFIRSGLGAIPWDVLHVGLAKHLPISLGTVAILTSLTVLLLWIPLRQLPGLGTLANAVLIGLVLDVAMRVLPAPESLGPQALLMAAGTLLNGLATAMYIGAQLGPGPRDGLMTALAARTPYSIRTVRTAIEVAVVTVGWLLGGVVGVGTVVYAVAIGPLVQSLLPQWIVRLPVGGGAGAGGR